jgi:hypothetical protein
VVGDHRSVIPFDPQPHLVGDVVELRPLRADDFDAVLAAASDLPTRDHANGRRSLIFEIRRGVVP